jgi:phosphatidylglycerophosphate synthase
MKIQEIELGVECSLNNNSMYILPMITSKWKTILTIIIINLLTVSRSFADPGDGLCDGNDGGPDGCPLDTWVWALILVAALFTIRHLSRKNKVRTA